MPLFSGAAMPHQCSGKVSIQPTGSHFQESSEIKLCFRMSLFRGSFEPFGRVPYSLFCSICIREIKLCLHTAALRFRSEKLNLRMHFTNNPVEESYMRSRGCGLILFDEQKA